MGNGQERPAALVLLVALAAAALAAQPNPYRTVEGWAKMPEGRTWGATSAVDIDKDGTSVWVAERCGANDCVESTVDPVLAFDAEGTLVKSFGAGLPILSPHGIFSSYADQFEQIWQTCTPYQPQQAQ